MEKGAMMTKSHFFIPSVIFLFAGTPLCAAQTIAEECHGTETVKIGSAEPRSVPYSLNFKADLVANTYCYGSCTKEQTYSIADAKSSPMKLADLERGGQKRHLIFDRVSGKLTDYQVFDAGLGTVTRSATAVCKPSRL
ncbi:MULTISPECIES: hypothetical protein [unclassified Sphingomonas]|uniref:hypothetical protein n=1 Tax=unclassified Sphingomonas TaxID=196159 RepID=UPI0010F4A25B|nr:MULTISPECIES: hypothetical protein [unclassified Sphingomonas]